MPSIVLTKIGMGSCHLSFKHLIHATDMKFINRHMDTDTHSKKQLLFIFLSNESESILKYHLYKPLISTAI